MGDGPLTSGIAALSLRTRRIVVTGIGLAALLISFIVAVVQDPAVRTEYLEAFAIGVVLGVVLVIPYQRWWRAEAYRWDKGRQQRFMPIAMGIGLLGVALIRSAPAEVQFGFWPFIGVVFVGGGLFSMSPANRLPPRPDSPNRSQ
jgi:hypothetical protein